MHPHILFILSLLAISLGRQLVRAAYVGVANYKCIDKERQALLDFKAHLRDPAGRLSSWGAEEEEDDDCCEWYGVTCNNQTGHVTKLDMSDYYSKGRLEGEIHNSLLNLTYLNHLDLCYNSLNGTIPRDIGYMTQLRYLNLGDNKFYGIIPSSIGSLTQLRYLYIGGNTFHGIIPPELGNLTNLRELLLENRYGGCTIENIDWLSHLSHLQFLHMGGVYLAKANNWVNVILSLKKLSDLSLQRCNLSRVMHPYSSSFVNSSSSSSIVSLNLQDNNLNSSMYHWLFPLTSNKLVRLDLSFNILDRIPKYLGNLCSLTILILDRNSIAVKFPDFLNNLSGCTSVTLEELIATYNQLTGSLSDEIQKFPSLSFLNLDYNHLNGTISEKIWELPKLELLVSSNFLRGAFAQNTNSWDSKIVDINLSNNLLEGPLSTAQFPNLSYVDFLDLSSCKLGPRFPKWIYRLQKLTSLNIANVKISDTIPTEFWNMWPSRLRHLNLSFNNMEGKVSDLFSNFDSNYHSKIDLSSNKLYGSIPRVPSSLVLLNLSRNKFYGGLSFLCQIVDSFLFVLDLSYNAFSGQLPDCLWHFKNLKVLNLGYNNLYGRLPASLESLTELEALYLYNNGFSGELPLSLKNCTKLIFLDLGANNFSGNVPIWIGENLSQLYALSLSSNNLFGPIPLQLCQLVNLRILDLSTNNLCGTIPSCVSNLTSMVQEGFLPTQNVHFLSIPWYNSNTAVIDGLDSFEYIDHAIIEWQGNVQEFSRTLGFVKFIDLSSNNLTGQIPYELANLYQLLALNLSMNALQGEIPRKIGEMKELQVLDLSRNSLSGGLPSSMSRLNFLNCLDVSHNKLTGRIPSSTQLQSFDPSKYTGNEGLCGLPVTKSCHEGGKLEVPPTFDESEGDGEDIDELWRWFYIGGSIGFAIGFWVSCSSLLLYGRGRHALFNFLDNTRDKVYVKVAVICAKLQRVADTE